MNHRLNMLDDGGPDMMEAEGQKALGPPMMIHI